MKRLILLLPLILISAVAHAEWELILDEETYSIASDGERLYAGTARGILYSRDDGDTWRLSDFKQPAVNLTASPDAIYASTWGLGIIRSVTKGNTWHLKNNGFDPRFDYPRVRQFLVTSFGMVIAVSNAGTWISRDRGDRWHSIIDEWEVKDQYGDGFRFGGSIWSMGEFGGYLWALYQGQRALCSPDEGATWETIPDWVHGRTIGQFGWAEVWITFRGEFYVAEGRGFGRWREEGLEWENLSHGLPEVPGLRSGVVYRDRIYAGSWRHDGVLRGDSVFVFDHHAETWYPAGLSDRSIRPGGLVSHRGSLYANVTSHGHQGVYRATIPIVDSYNKAVTTWGAMKQKQ